MAFRYILFFFFVVNVFTVKAQLDSTVSAKDRTKTVSRIRYTNQLLSGVMIGDSDDGGRLSAFTFHGLRVNRAAFGPSISYDNYGQWRALSGGASLNYDIIPSANGDAWFVQVNAAYSNLWYSPSSSDIMNNHAKHGTKGEVWLGYKFNAGKVRVIVVAGYRSHRLLYSQTSRWWTFAPEHFDVVRKINGCVFQIGFGI